MDYGERQMRYIKIRGKRVAVYNVRRIYKNRPEVLVDDLTETIIYLNNIQQYFSVEFDKVKQNYLKFKEYLTSIN